MSIKNKWLESLVGIDKERMPVSKVTVTSSLSSIYLRWGHRIGLGTNSNDYSVEACLLRIFF